MRFGLVLLWGFWAFWLDLYCLCLSMPWEELPPAMSNGSLR